MECILKFKELEKYFKNADFTDVKVFEGNTTLRRFIASMLSYYPWWIIQLYLIRKLLVGILGLVKHEAPEELPNLQPEEISFTPGENVTFFIPRKMQDSQRDNEVNHFMQTLPILAEAFLPYVKGCPCQWDEQ